jgi:hypothetical protein
MRNKEGHYRVLFAGATALNLIMLLLLLSVHVQLTCAPALRLP